MSSIKKIFLRKIEEQHKYVYFQYNTEYYISWETFANYITILNVVCVGKGRGRGRGEGFD